MTIWDFQKEFDSKEKLLQYLDRIQRLERAEIKKLGRDNWRLSFNLA